MTLQGIQFFLRLQAVYCAEVIEKIQSIQKRMTLVRGRLHLLVWRRGNPAGMLSCRAGYDLGVRSEGLSCVCFEHFERRTHYL